MSFPPETITAFRNDALTNGFTLSHELEEKIYKSLEEIEVSAGHSLGHRFRSWLKSNNSLPSPAHVSHVSVGAVKELAKRAENEPAIRTILDAVTSIAAPGWQIAKDAEANEAETVAFLLREQQLDMGVSEIEAARKEQEAKKNPQTLIAHAKKNGITLDVKELSEIVSALNDTEFTRLALNLNGLDINDTTTGRKGNRAQLPEKSITLTAHQFDTLQLALPIVIEKVAEAVAASHGYESPNKAFAALRKQEFGGRSA